MTKKKDGVTQKIRKKCHRPEPEEWLANLDRLRGETLFPEGRNQPMLRGNIDADKRRFFKLADQLGGTSDPAKRKRIQERLARIAFGN